MDIIRARGLASSGGWKEPHLLPISSGASIDGTLDLIFQGASPSQAEPPGPLMPVEAILPVENGHPYKAVRVRSATNAITLKTLPGYQEIAAPKEDCAKCVGKTFVAKGASAPAGVAASDVVKEADLTYPIRVIRPTDGIPNYVYDPNRLTLVLSEDGRIADAAWIEPRDGRSGNPVGDLRFDDLNVASPSLDREIGACGPKEHVWRAAPQVENAPQVDKTCRIYPTPILSS